MDERCGSVWMKDVGEAESIRTGEVGRSDNGGKRGTG